MRPFALRGEVEHPLLIPFIHYRVMHRWDDVWWLVQHCYGFRIKLAVLFQRETASRSRLPQFRRALPVHETNRSKLVDPGDANSSVPWRREYTSAQSRANQPQKIRRIDVLMVMRRR